MYKVNLLPPRLQREGAIDTRRLALIAGTALVAAAFLGGYAAFLINFFLMKGELAATRQQLASLAPVVSRAEKAKNEREQLEASLKEYHALLEKRLTWSDLLADLNNYSPVDLWLTELEISYKEETKAGKATPAPETQSAPGAPKTAGLSAPALKAPEGYARPNQVTLKGFSRTVPSVGVFMHNLDQLPRFREVKLRSLSAEKDGVKFEITAFLKEGS